MTESMVFAGGGLKQLLIGLILRTYALVWFQGDRTVFVQVLCLPMERESKLIPTWKEQTIVYEIKFGNSLVAEVHSRSLSIFV